MPQLWPQLSVRRGFEAVEFYKRAFGVAEDHRVGGSHAEESVVAQLSLGEAVFWVSDESPEHGNHSPESVGGGTTKMLLVVDDPEAACARAIAAGAIEESPVEEGHGWRIGRVKDPYGHSWEIASPPPDWPGTSGR